MLASTIVVATGNQHKVDELTALFAYHGLAVSLIPLAHVAPELTIDETGTTFEENAYIKAALVHAATGLPALADDSGLEVQALHGAPGVYSARYSGDGATDASNRALLLQNMDGIDNRAAAFRCVLCYVDDMRTVVAEGHCTGTIGHRESGTNGFGYDALFTASGDEVTFAELTADQKHQRSHRGAAVADFVRRIQGDEVVQDTPPFREALIRASIAAGTGRSALLETALARITTTQEASMMYEALLQSYLFGGFPAALDGLGQWYAYVRSRDVLPGTASPEEPSIQRYQADGTVLCKAIYGSVYERMMERLELVSPDLASWMIVEGYGKTLSRPGLSTVDRELCNAAILGALGRTTQLYSHVRGSLRMGATTDDLATVANELTEWCGAGKGDAVRAIVAELSV